MFIKHNKIDEGPKYEKKMVDIWQCSNCIGWMQKEYSMSQEPNCPLCSGYMMQGAREVNILL